MDWRELILDRDQIPELTPNFVHVWIASAADTQENLARFTDILNPEELARAARFHFDRDRRSFVVCRGTLRCLLAAYLRDDPAAIHFRHGPHGKPTIAHPAIPELQFNVSHSGEIALLAFTLGREVGVDVEKMRDDVDFLGVAKYSFSSAECQAVQTSSSSTRANLFYEYWSCKEACIKADGRGLSAPLDRFSVVPGPTDSRWRQVASTGDDSLSPDLRIRILNSGEGYAAAVAAIGNEWDVLQLRIA